MRKVTNNHVEFQISVKERAKTLNRLASAVELSDEMVMMGGGSVPSAASRHHHHRRVLLTFVALAEE